MPLREHLQTNARSRATALVLLPSRSTGRGSRRRRIARMRLPWRSICSCWRSRTRRSRRVPRARACVAVAALAAL